MWTLPKQNAIQNNANCCSDTEKQEGEFWEYVFNYLTDTALDYSTFIDVCSPTAQVRLFGVVLLVFKTSKLANQTTNNCTTKLKNKTVWLVHHPFQPVTEQNHFTYNYLTCGYYDNNTAQTEKYWQLVYVLPVYVNLLLCKEKNKQETC